VVLNFVAREHGGQFFRMGVRERFFWQEFAGMIGVGLRGRSDSVPASF